MAAPAPGAPGHPRGLRVVVSDYDPALRAFVATTLRRAGYCVFEPYNGVAACELATQIPDVRLLITDTRLQELATPELFRRARERMPWLAVLHAGDPPPGRTAPLAGAPVLREPFTPEELLAAAAALLEGRA